MVNQASLQFPGIGAFSNPGGLGAQAPRRFDVNSGLNAYNTAYDNTTARINEGKKKKTLSEISQLLESGASEDAMKAAFGGGMAELGYKIQTNIQAQEEQKRAAQTKFATWFSKHGRQVGSDPERLEAFKRAVPQISQMLGVGDGAGFNDLTIEELPAALTQFEMLSNEEFKSPKIVETYDPKTGQPIKGYMKGNEFVPVGGSKAPTRGQRITVGPDGGMTFEQGGSGSYSADPKLKKHFRKAKDAKGVETGEIEPIPGSEIARKWNESEKREKSKRLAAQRDSRILIDYADRTMKLIDDDPKTAAGPIAAVAQWIPGTAAYNAKWMIRTLQAKGAFDKLQEIRDNSKTGGAVGQLSDDERRALSDSMAQLEQSQSYEQLRYNLVQFRARYLDAAYGDIEGVYGYTWAEIEAQMKRTGKTREQILDNIAENVTPRKP